MKTTILSCPFCGARAQLQEFSGECEVYCPDCLAQMVITSDDYKDSTPEQRRDVLLAQWNRRPR
jgi:hypothetical protein